MTAIFKDTIEALYKFTCNASPCLKYSSYLERELALDANLVNAVIQMVLQELSALSPKQENKKDENTTSQEQVQNE